MASGAVRALLPRSSGLGFTLQAPGLLGRGAGTGALGSPAAREISTIAARAHRNEPDLKPFVRCFDRSPKYIAQLSGLQSPATRVSPWASPISILRQFSTSRTMREQANKSVELKDKAAEAVVVEQEEAQLTEFGKSEKAKQAAQVNLSARLSKEKDPKKSKNLLQSMRSGELARLLRLARPDLKYFLVAMVFLFISSTVTLAIPHIVGKIMDFASNSSFEDTRIYGMNLYQFFGALAVVLTLGASANFGRIMILRFIGERVVARLRSQLYKKTFLQDAEFFDANRTGDLISRLSFDSIIVGKSITQNFSDGLRALISGCAALTLMVWTSPGLSSVILFASPVIGVVTYSYARVIRKISRDIQKNIGTLTKIAEERLGNVKTSQAFTGEVQEVHRYNKQIRRIFNLGMKESTYNAMYFGSIGWMGNMTILAMLWFGGGFVRDGALSVGELTSFMMYAAFAGGSMTGLSGFFTELMKGVGAATRLFELQDRDISISPTKGVKVISARGPVKFDKVAFAYPTRPAVPIFNELNFTIPSGSNVCIVGPSGGGKSTVASILLRFYNPTAGSVSINGVDITQMNAKSLRRRIGVVPQEPVLFSGSIKDNIAYGRPRATPAEIFAAAQEANCQFIKDFPDGMDTQVGPRGAQLSGGQKQRIAIARALLKNPDILILDEATSALDAESETLVNAALAKLLRGNSTTISIAHRLSTIKRSDQIIVLSSEGTVAEMGSYIALSSDPNSAFSKLMEWQMSGGDIPPPPPLQPRHIPIEEAEAMMEEQELLEQARAEEEEEAAREEAEEAEKAEKAAKSKKSHK